MSDLIKVKISDRYYNPFITTIRGDIFYKEKYTECKADNEEIEFLINQGILEVENQDAFNIKKNNI